MNHKAITQKNIWLLCLSLILAVVAPMRALALPAATLAEATGCGTPAAQELRQESKMACCQTLKECCCSPAPLEPNNLESAAQPGQSTKLIPVKTAARPTHSPLAGAGGTQASSLSRYMQSLTALSQPLPLYLLKRSLLI